MHVITDESIFVHNFMVHKKKPNKTKVGVILLSIAQTMNIENQK
jgi:hypothetical protein